MVVSYVAENLAGPDKLGSLQSQCRMTAPSVLHLRRELIHICYAQGTFTPHLSLPSNAISNSTFCPTFFTQHLPTGDYSRQIHLACKYLLIYLFIHSFIRRHRIHAVHRCSLLLMLQMAQNGSGDAKLGN